MSLTRTLLRNLARGPFTEPAPPTEEATVRSLADQLHATARARLGRSLAIRQVDAGSCNGCELEIAALANLRHDLESHGLRFVASPRHADVLLVTGPLTRNMRVALERTHGAMPQPAFVVAVGDCGADGGVFKGSPAVMGGVDRAVPVDLIVHGCPPTPATLLQGLLTLLRSQERPRSVRQGAQAIR